ncbi:hypothetical protein SAMN04487846_0537 [Microbacterium sp. cf046]|uniref:dehydrogenase n=1 Tax=Microbacterium sp. cf046 TaxID=1761803 RepID=UPI0008EBC989|nr:dehydrogenase [Microbacterium sp. cf046]SFR91346.1 hypothetical protein SAMN04487846_0537 [Microbacterium sp. cf046]
MPEDSETAHEEEPPEFRNTALSDALQTQDLAAVAFALRHGPTVVPLQPAGADAPGEVWTYRNPTSGTAALLLFSDVSRKPDSLPPAVALNTPGWLRAFLGLHQDDISTVFLDIAGPHPMQATPADLIAALDA